MNVATSGRYWLRGALPALSLSLFALVLALVLPSAANAAFPGANSRIAWDSNEGGSDTEIVTSYLDGSGFQQLTNNTDNDATPAWSPNGKKIAYSHFNSAAGGFWEIWTMDANGANQQPLVTEVSVGEDTQDPTWSRDGSRIAFVVGQSPTRIIYRADTSGLNTNVTQVFTGADSLHPAYAPNSNKIAFSRRHTSPSGFDLYTINDDGTSQTPLLSIASTNLGHATWSPDGAQLAFDRFNGTNYDLYTINADGTGSTPIATSSADEFSPAWAPEGNMIAFTRASPAGSAGEIYNLTTGAPIVTRAANDDRNPDWQPLLAAQVRPKGATPIFLSLVPAFNQCTSPNATHDAPNPPLISGSCVPARPTNSFVTVGEPQVNGKGANFAGSVTIRAISGDTQFIVNVADVRSVFDLSDYTSRLRLRYAIRLTDRANPAGTAGTLQDAVFSSDDVQCTATVDTTVGSTCALTTTLNSIVPGVVVSGRRAIWRLQSLSLQTLNGVDFAVPGTFTP